MGLPVFIDPPEISLVLPEGEPVTFQALCDLAKVKCKVSGISTHRPLRIALARELCSVRLPGQLSPVWLGIPRGAPRRRALLALGVLAYGVFDYAARETLRGLPESRASAGPGRPRKTRPLTVAERQSRHREREKIRARSGQG
jgi:hypothetical protein